MGNSLRSVLLVLIAVPGAAAQQPTGAQSAERDMATVQRFAELQEAEREAAAIRAAANAKNKTAAKDDLEARAAWLAELQRASRLVEAATDRLRQAFDRGDWNAWRLPQDAVLLEKGLDAAARHALEPDPERAVRAWEMLIDKLPRCGAADHARRTWLPIAWPSTGKLEAAAKRIEELTAQVDEQWRYEMRVHLADVHALAGDLAKARAVLEDAVAKLPPLEGLKKYDPAVRAKSYYDLRLALLGNKAPQIDAERWLGAPAQPLSALAGKVVVLDFWATWCQPCRTVMPGLDAMYRELAAHGLVVLGVTRHYPHGFLPNSAADIHTGKSVRDMDEAAFLAHLTEFKKVTGLGYPFVIGTTADFESYKVPGIPTVVVIGKDQTVRYIAVGSCREALIRQAVERCLDEKDAGR